MTGYHRLDPLQGERDVDDGAELRDRAVACQRDKNRARAYALLSRCAQPFLLNGGRTQGRSLRSN